MRPDLEALRMSNEIEIPQDIKKDLIKFTESGRPYLALVEECITEELGRAFEATSRVFMMGPHQHYPGQNFMIQRDGTGIQFSLEPMAHFNDIGGDDDDTHDYPNVEMNQATNESLRNVIRHNAKDHPPRIQAEKEIVDRLILTKVGMAFWGAARNLGRYNRPEDIADLDKFIKAVYTCRKGLLTVHADETSKAQLLGIPRGPASTVAEFVTGLPTRVKGGRKTRKRIPKRKTKGTKHRKYRR